MKKFTKYLLLLIHYWFPIVIGWSVVLVIQKATGLPISPLGLCLYLLAIWAAYSIDRLLDPEREDQWPRWFKIALWAGFVIPSISGAILALRLLPQTLFLIVVFSVVTFLYRQLKKVPFIKVLLVSVVWIWAGVALPFQNQNWFAWQFWTLKTSLPLVLLFGISVAMCDFKDLNQDLEDGVLSLPVLLGSRNSILFLTIGLVITGMIALEQGRFGLVTSSAILIGLAQFPTLLSFEAVGPLLVDAALTVPGIMIFLHLF